MADWTCTAAMATIFDPVASVVANDRRARRSLDSVINAGGCGLYRTGWRGMPVVVLLISMGAVGLFLALPGRGVTFARAGLLLLIAGLAVALASLIPRFGPSWDRPFFFVLSIIGVLSAVRVITHPRPIYSALFFILVVVVSGGLLILMDATFLAVAVLIIYAGAILVTYLFVIMLSEQGRTPAACDTDSREPFFGVLAGFIVLAVISGRIMTGEPSVPPGDSDLVLGSVEPVGQLLLTEYVVAVQVAGVLLLAAMVGAVAVAKRRAWGSEQGDAA